MTIEQLHAKVEQKLPRALQGDPTITGQLIAAVIAELGFYVDEASGELIARMPPQPYRPQEPKNVRYAGMRKRR